MVSAVNSLNAELLAQYSPLSHLTASELELLVASTVVQTARKGERLLRIGSDAEKTLYLVKGKIRLKSDDGRTTIIDSTMARAREPISHLVPHHYQVDCLSEVSFFWVHNRVLDNLSARDVVSGEMVENIDVDHDILNNRLFQEIYRELSDDKLDLPMMPDIAVRLRGYIGRDESVDNIAKLLMTDPALAAHLIKVANSVIFYAQRQVVTVKEAVIRIGCDLVMNYVLSFSVKKLFRGKSPALRERMKALWKHSTEVAAIGYVMAQELPNFNADHAMILGLLHDIGMLPILSYVDTKGHGKFTTDEIDQAIELLHGELGGLIMAKWNFSLEFINVAREADDWFRDKAHTADYCDLILLSQLISFLGKRINLDTPPMDERRLPDSMTDVPAFHKLGFSVDDPDQCFNLLNKAKQTIEEMKRNLLH